MANYPVPAPDDAQSQPYSVPAPDDVQPAPMAVQGAPGNVAPQGPVEGVVPAKTLTPVQKALQYWRDTAKGVGKAGLVLAEGMAAPGMAINQLGNKALGAMGAYSPETMARLNAESEDQQAMMAQDRANVWGGEVVHGAGQALATAPLMAIPGAPAGAGLLPKVGYGAAQAGLVGTATRFMNPETEKGQSFSDTLSGKSADSLVSGGIGAAMGASIPIASAGVSALGKKGASMLAGTKLGDLLGIETKINPRWAGAEAFKEEMDKTGIRTSAGDITGNAPIRAREEGLARNNEKMMDWRKGQNQEAAAYAQGIVDDLKKTVQDTGWTNLADVEAAVAAGGKRSEKAKLLVDAIKNSGDDWKEIAQQSGNLKLFLNKLKADQLYDHAEQIASTYGKVGTSNLDKALGGSILDLEGNTASPEGAKTLLDRIQMGVKGADTRKVTFSGAETPSTSTKSLKMNDPATGMQFNPDGLGLANTKPNHSLSGSVTPASDTRTASLSGTFTPGKQDTTFGGLRKLRSSLNTRISDIMEGKVVASSEELPHLERVVKAIENDLDHFASINGPELKSVYQEAADHYKTQVVPYKEMAFGKALADTDTLKLTNIFKTKNSTQQQRMFNLLEPKGQAAIRHGLIDDALSAGEKTGRGIEGQTFGSANVANALEKLESNGTMGVAFKGEDKWAASGLGKILRTIDRSDNVAFVPKTGETAERLGAKAKGDLTILGAVAKSYDWLTRDRLFKMYTDPKMKALLVRASDLPPGSKAMWSIINNDIPKLAGVTAGSKTGTTAESNPTENQ